MTGIAVRNASRNAEALVDLLVDDGPLTSAEACERLGWSRGRFDAAVRSARDELCPDLGLTIPHPIPDDGWRYQVTTDWKPVEAGASYSLGMIEARLSRLHRDIGTVKPHLTKGSRDWRRANFLDKHLGHIVSTLREISGG